MTRRAAARRRFLTRLGFAVARARAGGHGLLEQPRLWVFALIVGALASYAAVGFVLFIELLHGIFFGADQSRLVDKATALSPLVLIAAPTLGGLLIGLLFRLLCARWDYVTVADVIEARALASGRVPAWRAAISTLAAGVALGSGASAGREGPAVVAGACISTLAARVVSLNGFEQRTLLGCAAAAAVSASFNAPIAGALFALEVVLGHYAVRAFAPITIASVLGAVISRTHLGDAPAFLIPPLDFGSYAQFPALFLLGLLSAAVAMIFMTSLQVARDIADRLREATKAPIWAQTGLAGLIVGLMAALGAPEVLGVGYQTTNAALAGEIGFWSCVMIVVAKTAASAVTMGCRLAAGVFSPALMLGALTGSAYGMVATDVFPAASGDLAIYALAGMGAVAGAVLGAPISTTLIVFELSADYGAAIAVMVSTSVATVATQQIFRKSYFHWQLARRGVDLISGPHHAVLPGLKAGRHMRWRGSENGASDSASWELARQGAFLAPGDDFRRAFELFRGARLTFLPVLDPEKESTDPAALLGALFYVDALEAYNRGLAQLHEEEHS